MDFYSLPKRCSLKIGVMCCFLHVRKKGAENDQYKRNVYQLGRRWKQKATDPHNNNIPYLYRAKQKKKKRNFNTPKCKDIKKPSKDEKRCDFVKLNNNFHFYFGQICSTCSLSEILPHTR